jgi:hypothetical protein
MAVRNAAVAAGSQWTDPDDGVRYPAGEVHAWERGRNETVCGLSLSKSRLARFPHVDWPDVQPESGRHAEGVQVVCPGCRAAGPLQGTGPSLRGTGRRGSFLRRVAAPRPWTRCR